MASCPPTQEGWFIERGVNHGIGLDSIFFSNRAFLEPTLYAPGGAQREATSHYASPRTPQRSLHSWGTYSPPPQRASPGADSTAGASPVGPSSLSGSHAHHAHTLPLPRRALAVFRPCIPQEYKTSTVDRPRMLKATITSSLLASNQRSPSQNQPPKDQDQNKPGKNYQDQAIRNQPCPKPVYTKRPTALQPKDNPRTDSKTTKIDNNSHRNIKRQVDMISQNVFGQPRVQASLRGPLSPRQNHKSSLEEELRRLIILDMPDNTTEERNTNPRSPSPENSLGSGPLDTSLACSPVSDCPELDHLSASDLSLPLGWDPAWGLEWSNLVDAAIASDGQRTKSPLLPSKPSIHESEDRAVPHPSTHYPPQRYNNQPTQRSDVSSDLSSRLHYLEALLRHLESNLERERQDKVALLEEVTVLRETNQRLWEESLTANEQLRKLTLLFNVAPGMLPRGERE